MGPDEPKNYTPLKVPHKKSNKGIFAVLSLFLVVLAGLVSSYFLFQKPLPTSPKAFTWTGQPNSCGILEITGATENPQCPALTSNTNLTPNDPNRKNNVSSYSVIYTIHNKTGQAHKVFFNRNSNFCTQPYGQLQSNVGCWDNANLTADSVVVQPNENFTVTVNVSASAYGYASCGSYQTDLAITGITDLNGTSECNIPNPGLNLGGTSVCQTGTTCEQPTATPTPTPTTSVSNTPTPTPTATPTPTPTTSVSNTPTPTPTATPTGTPSPTLTPTITPTPQISACGGSGCNNTTSPCQAGLICVQANNGNNYCTKPELQNACKSAPGVPSCCNGPTSTNTPTPTEIVLVKTSPTPTTSVTPVTTVPSAGVVPWFVVLAPAALLIVGLLF